jgi:hypothetical protein
MQMNPLLQAAMTDGCYIPRNPVTLASFGGTFITGGQKGRRAVPLTADEDSAFEREFVNAHDRLRGHYRTPDEVSSDESVLGGARARANAGDGDEVAPSLARRLLTTQLRQFQVLAVANAVLEDSRILVALYREAKDPDTTIIPANRPFAQKKMFGLMRDIVPVMRKEMTKSELVRLLRKHRDDETGHSVLRCLLDFAREEAAAKSHCFAAREFLAELGCRNVFARYVD